MSSPLNSSSSNDPPQQQQAEQGEKVKPERSPSASAATTPGLSATQTKNGKNQTSGSKGPRNDGTGSSKEDEFAAMDGGTQITFSQVKAFSSPLPVRHTYHQMQKQRSSLAQNAENEKKEKIPEQSEVVFTCHCADTGSRRRVKLYRQRIEGSTEYQERAKKIEQSQDLNGFWGSCYAGFQEEIQRDLNGRRHRTEAETESGAKSSRAKPSTESTTTMLTYGHYFGGRSDGAIIGWLLSRRMGQYAYHERTIGWHAGKVTSMAFLEFCEDYFGGLLFTGSTDSRVHIWDPWAEHPQSMLVQSLTIHMGAITSLELMGLQLVSASFDGTCVVWNPNFQKECSRPYYLHYEPIQRIRLPQDAWACGASLVNIHLGRSLVIGDSLGRVHVYINNADTNSPQSKDGKEIKGGADEMETLGGDYKLYRSYPELHKLRITFMAHLENTSHIATIATDHTCKITDIVSGRVLCTVVHPAFRPVLPSLMESMTMSRTAARVASVISKAADRMVGKKASDPTNEEGASSIQISQLADELISEDAEAALGSSRLAKTLSDCIFVCCEWDEHYQQLYLSDRAGRIFAWNIYANVCVMQADLQHPKQCPFVNVRGKEAEKEKRKRKELEELEKSMPKAGHLPVADTGVLATQDDIEEGSSEEIEFESKEAAILMTDVDDIRRKYYRRAIRVKNGYFTEHDAAVISPVSSQSGREASLGKNTPKTNSATKQRSIANEKKMKLFTHSFGIRREGELIYLSITLGHCVYELSVDRTSVTAWKKHHTGALLGLHVESPESCIQSVDRKAGKRIMPGMCRYRHSGAVTKNGIMLSASRDNSLVCWDLWNVEPLYRLVAFQHGSADGTSFSETAKLQSEVTSLCYLPNPEILLTGHNDGTLLVWKKDSKEQEKYYYHSGTISSIMALESRDGSYQVISSDHSGMLCIWKQEGERLRFAKKKHLIKDITNMPQKMQKLLYGTPEESERKTQAEEMLYTLHLSGSNIPRIRTIQAALSATKGRRHSLLGRRLSARLSIPLEDKGEERRRSQIESARDELHQRGVAITCIALFLPVREGSDDLVIVGCEDGIVRIFLVTDVVLVSMLDTTLATRPVSFSFI
eukprot:gb/GECG01006296.1/.p1 GENE.gb/GECG01006296.1/~~gb/GECG01006296.1/.p1  ORF type:complete len:1100 (+),score=147.72 gb/GECG01006296.1/:1-3300(+)